MNVKLKNLRKVERMEIWESPKETERGAVDAPPRKRKNTQRLQQQRLRSPRDNNNLRLDCHKVKIASFGPPQGDKTVKQAMPAAESSALENRIKVNKAYLKNRQFQIARSV